MKKTSFFTALVGCTLLFAACGQTPQQQATAPEATKPDMAKVKSEIQALATKWADAENARDAKTVAAFYADDAIRLANNMPMIVGKANILKSLEDELANTPQGSTIFIETVDVLGNETDVIEVGRAILKDTTGKITYTGKYLAYWQKRNGKYVVVRDMTNDDAKSN